MSSRRHKLQFCARRLSLLEMVLQIDRQTDLIYRIVRVVISQKMNFEYTNDFEKNLILENCFENSGSNFTFEISHKDFVRQIVVY